MVKKYLSDRLETYKKLHESAVFLFYKFYKYSIITVILAIILLFIKLKTLSIISFILSLIAFGFMIYCSNQIKEVVKNILLYYILIDISKDELTEKERKELKTKYLEFYSEII